MSLEVQIMSLLKEAMKNKDEAALRALRAIKAEIIKAKTEPGSNGNITSEGELKLLQKLAKQRKESIETFRSNGREDLATKEEEELKHIETFLPQPLSTEELKTVLQTIIAQIGATSPADMGKVMGVASKQLAGKADGKTISEMVKSLLTA